MKNCQYRIYTSSRGVEYHECSREALWQIVNAPDGTAYPERETVFYCTQHKNRHPDKQFFGPEITKL
jgi:hypothetical protein